MEWVKKISNFLKKLFSKFLLNFTIVIVIMMFFLSYLFYNLPINNMKEINIKIILNHSINISIEVQGSFYENDDDIIK